MSRLRAAGVVLSGLLAPGAVEAQVTVPEGGEVHLQAPEGATTWAWDIDNGGAFDDCVDAAECLFSAAERDGPDVEPVRRLVDGVIDRVEVEIENVPPSVLSDPPTTARRGGEYRYTPVIADPVGDRDQVTLELLEGPEDMFASWDVTWTPTELNLTTNPHLVRLRVADGDGGSFEQAWEIVVSDNAPPPAPPLLYPTAATGCAVVPRPTLKLENVTDPDGDPVTYFFELGNSPGFFDPQRSGPVEAGLEGLTEWQVPRPLRRGTPFYWRAWATDGIEESIRIVEVFEMCFVDPCIGDECLPRRRARPSTSGCACWPQPAENAPEEEELCLIGLALLFVLRPHPRRR